MKIPNSELGIPRNSYSPLEHFEHISSAHPERLEQEDLPTMV
jgi:hypothetical protein